MEYRYKLDNQALAAKVRAARKAAHMTQAELAEKIDISTNAVAKLETNLMSISLQTLVNIANVLDIDLNYLLSAEESRNTAPDTSDMFLESMIHSLSIRDKTFVIHMINGLKAYNAESKGN